MTEASALARGEDEKLDLWNSIPFFAVHAVAIVAPFFLPFSWKLVGLAVLLYYARMAGTTIGYHRYAAHRRNHHKYSDQPEDVHSPQRGFWWSHMGWILCQRYAATGRIQDLSSYPERRFLNRFHLVPPVLLGTGLFLLGGWSWLVWGFFVSTVLLWHGTFVVNSLNHVWGSRRYATTDTSRNNAVLALLTMGEGWHNNHHHYMSSANQGFFWWEFDPSYYLIRLFQALGLVWDVRTPPEKVRRATISAEAGSDAAPAGVALEPQI